MLWACYRDKITYRMCRGNDICRWVNGEIWKKGGGKGEGKGEKEENR
jgi:hypothetical protein